MISKRCPGMDEDIEERMKQKKIQDNRNLVVKRGEKKREILARHLDGYSVARAESSCAKVLW